MSNVRERLGLQQVVELATRQRGLAVAELLTKRAVDLKQGGQPGLPGLHERHANGPVLERAAEAGLALTGALAGPAAVCAHLLVQPPVHHARDAGGSDEGSMDECQDPGIARMVVDRCAVEDPDQPVVEYDEAERDEKRSPILVERDDDDHHEEHEVRLDGAVGEVHRERRGHAQAVGGQSVPRR